jgi:hypothetical protein
MLCPKCGTANADLDRYCIACRADLTDVARAQASGNAYHMEYPAAGAGGYGGFQSSQSSFFQPAYQTSVYPQGGSQQGGAQQVYQGYPYPSYQARMPVRPVAAISNYLVWAILTLVFCWLPGGIVATVYASQVNGKLSAGDYDGALDASRKAKKWCWISFGVGIGVFVLAFAIGFVGGFLRGA